MSLCYRLALKYKITSEAFPYVIRHGIIITSLHISILHKRSFAACDEQIFIQKTDFFYKFRSIFLEGMRCF